MAPWPALSGASLRTIEFASPIVAKGQPASIEQDDGAVQDVCKGKEMDVAEAWRDVRRNSGGACKPIGRSGGGTYIGLASATTTSHWAAKSKLVSCHCCQQRDGDACTHQRGVPVPVLTQIALGADAESMPEDLASRDTAGKSMYLQWVMPHNTHTLQGRTRQCPSPVVCSTARRSSMSLKRRMWSSRLRRYRSATASCP